MNSKIKLLVTDLDNTLYDWVDFFAKSFQSMADEASKILGVDQEILLDEFKARHQAHGNSEQPFTILELPSVLSKFSGADRDELKKQLHPALHAFNSTRKQTLRLYGLVESCLRAIQEAGITIVGFTEATEINARFRLKALGIEKYFKYVCAGQKKPDPSMLKEICRREGVLESETCYLGDSLGKDIATAKAAGVKSIWARYGTKVDSSLWKILVRVTHWTAEDVARESEIKRMANGIEPDHTIDDFSQILPILGIA